MLPRRPYLLKAYYDWILDNNMTPYVIINVNVFGVKIPIEYVKNGQIILNIKPSAVKNFKMTYDKINFSARFCGVVCYIEVPISAIIAIYAVENREGIIFENEYEYEFNTNSVTHKNKKIKLINKNNKDISLLNKETSNQSKTIFNNKSPISSHERRKILRIIK
ncbi:ClpXP protease specificity-enhancing factor [Arsenophonus symbiont of Ornithomya chloropus]|uniref:ClpXP protease specificity-enhancing factor n=1 Tax=Arsenophonus symbiont of Ornithomya chloropus TaxID=634121 RepID=UPI0032B2CEA0